MTSSVRAREVWRAARALVAAASQRGRPRLLPIVARSFSGIDPSSYRPAPVGTAAWRAMMTLDPRLHVDGSRTYELLSIVVALSARRGDPIGVLDWGGANGTAYLAVRGAAPNADLRFHVVELPEMVEFARTLFAGDARIAFSSSIPTGKFDIVHSRSAIYMVEDWKALAKGLADVGAEHVVLADLPTTDKPSFACVRVDHRGLGGPIWMLNRGELDAIMHAAGYELILCRTPTPRPYVSALPGGETPVEVDVVYRRRR